MMTQGMCALSHLSLLLSKLECSNSCSHIRNRQACFVDWIGMLHDTRSQAWLSVDLVDVFTFTASIRQRQLAVCAHLAQEHIVSDCNTKG